MGTWRTWRCSRAGCQSLSDGDKESQAWGNGLEILSWAEEGMLGTAMGWVVGSRDQDAKPLKLQNAFLGHEMRHLEHCRQ